MIKEERLSAIMSMISDKEYIKVSDIGELLNVTEMTVRRDLQYLENKQLLKRVHGGATSISPNQIKELSHIEKVDVNFEEKKEIALKIVNEIQDGDTIFLGAGTTIELTYDVFNKKNVRIITNSLPLFNKFSLDENIDLILIGGTYRSKTGSFTGSITNDVLSNLNVERAFIGVNGIYEEGVYNSNENEGVTQKTILNSSDIKYLVADDSKIGRRDFYKFYDLSNIDYLIMNDTLNIDEKEKYGKYVTII